MYSLHFGDSPFYNQFQLCEQTPKTEDSMNLITDCSVGQEKWFAPESIVPLHHLKPVCENKSVDNQVCVCIFNLSDLNLINPLTAKRNPPSRRRYLP